MTAAILTAVFVVGGSLSLPYADMATCQADARILAEDKANVVSAECRTALHVAKGSYYAPRP